jgi:hypothetical protein
MRTTVTVVTANNGRREDVTIDAPAATPVDAILSRLRDLVSAPLGATANFGAGAAEVRREVPGTEASPIASHGQSRIVLCDGVIVTFGARLRTADTRCSLELRVVAGPPAIAVTSW